MRIFLASDGKQCSQGRLAIDGTVPSSIPEELRSTLNGAPTLNGAAFQSSQLEAALRVWAVPAKLDESGAQKASLSDDQELDLMLLPLLLFLGRDLHLVESGTAQVSLE